MIRPTWSSSVFFWRHPKFREDTFFVGRLKQCFRLSPSLLLVLTRDFHQLPLGREWCYALSWLTSGCNPRRLCCWARKVRHNVPMYPAGIGPIGQNIGARGPTDFGRSLWTMHFEGYPSLTRNGYDVYALLCKRYMNDLAVDAKQIITSDEGEGQCHPCCLNSSVVKLANLDSQPCRQT